MKNLVLLFLLVGINVEAAVLAKLSGTVLVNMKPAKVEASLSEGDIVEAKGKGSYAIVKFDEGTKAIISNGSLKIEKSGAKTYKVDLIRGLLSASLDKTKKKLLEVKTKNATMGVRGTKFLAMYEKDDTYLCVCEGTVEIKNKVGSKLVNRDEDIHVTDENQKTLVVQKANDQMWKMSVEQFKLMGLKVKPRS